MKITRCPQHFLEWDTVGGKEKFIADYSAATSYEQRRILIESVPMQTNPEWKKARRGHITASTMKDFLGMNKSKTGAGEGYKKAVKRLVAEELGWEEPELTWSDRASTKRGLIMESRALELFTQETGIEMNTDIGFISTEIDGLPFGCSPDAYAGEPQPGKIVAIGEVKSFELMHLMDELEKLDTKEIAEQMQGALMVAECPVAYKILYCAEIDKVFYMEYKRAGGFTLRLRDRIPLAKAYREFLLNRLNGTSNLTKLITEL